MSTWPSQLRRPLHLSPLASMAGGLSSVRRVDHRVALWLACLICLLIAQGVAITQSYLWAAPLICLLVVALATELPMVPFLGLALVVRVFTDDLSSSSSRHSGSLNLSSLIAGTLILVAIGLLVRRQRAVWPAILAALWLCLWTAIAIKMNGASTVTLREGVREASIVAVALIACNARGVLTLPIVTRLIQLAGIISALIALYQLATHTGQSVGGEIRSNGTFSQPNAAAVFCAIATLVSLWRFLDNGHRRSDAVFLAVYATATVSTFSLGGLACLLVMLVTFGLLRPGSLRLKLGSCAVAVIIIIAFLATPLGAERIASESSTNLRSTGAHRPSGSSLEWRFDKWRTLIPEWELHPLLGRGLGTTTVTEGTAENHTAGILPHSEFVRYLVETGVVGFLTLLGGVLFLLLRFARLPALPESHEAGALGIALILGLLVNALVANTLLYTPAAYAAALIAAVALTPQPGSRSFT